MAKITTEEQALVAVKKSKNAFKYVPEAMKTEKVCLAAVKSYGGWLPARRRPCRPRGTPGKCSNNIKGVYYV